MTTQKEFQDELQGTETYIIVHAIQLLTAAINVFAEEMRRRAAEWGK